MVDAIDGSILQMLKRNSRATASEISKQVKLSIPAVTERIKKMEHSGVIRQYTVRLSHDQMGYHLLAFVFVNIDKTENVGAFRSQAVAFENVMECHHVAGQYDYVLKVLVRDTGHLEQFLSDQLKAIPGVASTNTFIALTTLKENSTI